MQLRAVPCDMRAHMCIKFIASAAGSLLAIRLCFCLFFFCLNSAERTYHLVRHTDEALICSSFSSSNKQIIDVLDGRCKQAFVLCLSTHILAQTFCVKCTIYFILIFFFCCLQHEFIAAINIRFSAFIFVFVVVFVHFLLLHCLCTAFELENFFLTRTYLHIFVNIKLVSCLRCQAHQCVYVI